MKAAYVFDAAFRVPATGVSLDPNRFETTLRLHAPAPGVEPGAERIDWLFFRDRLWRGEIGDEAPLRGAASDWLDSRWSRCRSRNSGPMRRISTA